MSLRFSIMSVDIPPDFLSYIIDIQVHGEYYMNKDNLRECVYIAKLIKLNYSAKKIYVLIKIVDSV